MKEHPILFSGPMVKAILEGRKTQTRRVVTFLPEYSNAQYVRIKREDRISKYDPVLHVTHEDAYAACPYGKSGDRLWVRETFFDAVWAGGKPTATIYAADSNGEPTSNQMKWKPSIFMPRRASRITLEIASVRVERLQKITFSDIRAEGKKCPEHDFDSGFCASECASLRGEWATGWDKINGKRKGCDWNSNPWVWVIEFKNLASARNGDSEREPEGLFSS